jgi:putative protease
MDIRHSSPSEDRQPFKASASIVCEKQLAQKPQRENIIRQLTKLGNTPYCCDHIEIDEGADKYFIPSSMLAELRRKAIMAITPVSPSPSTQDSVPSVPQDSVPSAPQDSVPSVPSVVALPQQPLPTYPYPYMYNIANRQARAFYEAQGLHPLAPAFELSRPREAVLMQCRHCLRYALGCCVKYGGQKPSWREPLYLELPDRRRFRLEFDCKHCQMNIYAE